MRCTTLGDPAAALRRAYDQLTPGGIVAVVEPWSINPSAYGLGPGGRAEAEAGAADRPGFLGAHVAVDTGQNLVLAAHTAGYVSEQDPAGRDHRR